MTFQFPGFQHRLHIDYETYGEVELPKTGAHKYAADPNTEVLMVAYALDDGPVKHWDQSGGEPIPREFWQMLDDPTVALVAFNAEFERIITRDVLGHDTELDQWRCTAVAARYLGFSGSLDNILQQARLGVTKDQRGGQLIHRFSKPAPKNHKAERYDWSNKPQEWKEFCEYNVQDVVVERQLLYYLTQFPMMHDWDWQRYAVDQRINDRGIYVDTEMASGAVELWEHERAQLTEQLRELTEMPKVTRDPVMGWLAQNGMPLNSMRKEDLQPIAEDPDTDPTVARALNLWLMKEAKATSKYNAVLQSAQEDSRARGMFAFKGASRTDRTSGRRLQLQNLKRPITKTDVGAGNLRNAIASADPELVKMVSGESVSEAMGAGIRHCIQASPGRKLAVCDLSSIESVVLGWLTYCQPILNIFHEGRDTYKPLAAQHFRKSEGEVTKDERTFAKPAVLGAGYMLGGKGMLKYAEGMGVEMDEGEAHDLVQTFRTMYSEVPQFWTWIDQACQYVILSGKSCTGYRLHLERDSEFLRIWLPSGRALSYHLPAVEKRVAPWASVETRKDYGKQDPLQAVRAENPGKTDGELAKVGALQADSWVDNVSYMGSDPLTTQWGRIYVHAGLFTENIVQSIAYDILFDGLTRAERMGLLPVLQVHDEIGCEVPESETVERPGQPDALTRLTMAMTRRPSWAPDIPLSAEGFYCKYYTKD